MNCQQIICLFYYLFALYQFLRVRFPLFREGAMVLYVSMGCIPFEKIDFAMWFLERPRRVQRCRYFWVFLEYPFCNIFLCLELE